MGSFFCWADFCVDFLALGVFFVVRRGLRESWDGENALRVFVFLSFCSFGARILFSRRLSFRIRSDDVLFFRPSASVVQREEPYNE